MLTRLFLAVWRMSAYGAATALVVGAAVLLLRRLRVGRAVCCALWLAVLARLLCPVSLPSPLSIWSAPALGRWVGAAKGVEAQAEDFWAESPPGAPLTGGALPGGAAGAAGGEAAVQAAQPGQAAAPRISPRQPGGAADNGAADPGRPGAGLTLPAAVWLTGAVGMVLRALWQTARLRGHLALACRAGGEPDVFTSERVAEPFSFGLLHPRIYLPAGLSGGERRMILLHERAHLRRRDHLVKPLFYAAVCLHWFNPLAWLAFRGMACDMEAACDEAVLRAAGSGVKAAYCESLLRFAAPQNAPRRAAAALHFGEGRAPGRVRAILHYRRPAVWAGLAAGLAAALLAAACMADPAGAPDAQSAGSNAAGSAPADSVPAGSTPADSAPAGGQFAESAAAESKPAEHDSSVSVPALEGEALPEIYSADGSLLLWPVPQYTGWQEEDPATFGYSNRICAPEGSVVLAMADGRITEASQTSLAEDGSPELGRIGLLFPNGTGSQGNVLQSVQYVGSLTPLVREGDEVSQGQVIATLDPCDDPDGPSCYLFRYGIDLLRPLSEQFPQIEQPELMTKLLSSPQHAPADEDPGRLTWPVPEYTHVSRWMDSAHKGADLVAKAGVPILAAADGTVISAFYHYSYGNFVVVDHGNGWRSLYAHCSELLVSEGDEVEQGEEIARVGATGNATGRLCHFELYRGGTRMDAKDYFPAAENGGPVPDYLPKG